MQLENGDYDAKIAGGASVYESSNGNLVACFNVDLGEIDRKCFISLTCKNGSEINERAVKELKRIFTEWNGDPSWLKSGDNINGEVVIARVENEKSKTGDKVFSNVKGIFHPLHVPMDDAGEMPESMDSKTIAAKYASKFRAMVGSVAPVEKLTAPTPRKPAGKEDNVQY